MSGPFLQALLFIIGVLLSLYAVAILLRFVLQVSRADFYNPVVQAIVYITNPVLAPLRKIMILPGARLFDYASLVAALGFTTLMLLLRALGESIVWSILLLHACFQVLQSLLDIYLFAIFIVVIISWVAPNSTHPGAQLVRQITQPILVPIRRLMPQTGMLDFSVLVAVLVLLALKRYIVPGFLSALT